MRLVHRIVLLPALAIIPLGAVSQRPAPGPVEELLIVGSDEGRHGGRLVVALRSEPRTLNPVVATDGPSRDVIGTMAGDLIHVNRSSQLTEPALAKSWQVSDGGRQYTLNLRRGLRFSNGHAVDADDVLFTFRVLLDDRIGAPQRDLLIVGGQPITVTKIDAQTVRVTLAQPYAAAERLFDSIAILPRHLLEPAYEVGTLAQAWTLNTARAAIAGLGPFRLKEYVAGQRLVLERNPYYWKADRAKKRLPYLDELVFLFVGTEDAEVIRFQSGESDVLGRASAENFAVLARDRNAARYQLTDLGPSLEYNFVFFNLNDLTSKKLPQIAAKQRWFREVKFRQAVSRAIDREAIRRLAYRGLAVPLWGNVTPGNKLWVNEAIPRPPRSVEQARALLRDAGFSWRPDGGLVDREGQPVEFSIAASSSNAQRMMMATLVQDDLRQLGMKVQVVSLEFRALLDRVFQTFDYEACLLGLGGGDGDPNGEMNVWLSRGSSHLWSLGQDTPPTSWEAEIDRLMERQLVTLNHADRKALFDRVQQLVAEQLPFIFLASPHVLIGARKDLANFHPAALAPHTLWNVEQLFFRPQQVSVRP